MGIHKNLNFDWCACLIMIILIVSTISRHMVKGKVNRSYFRVLLVTEFSIAFDLWAVMLDNQNGADVFLKYVAHTGYLVCHSLALPLYVVYIIMVSDTWHIFKKKQTLRWILTLPVAVTVGLILTNPITNIIFYLDENHVYTRGKAFGILYVCAAVYICYGLLYLIRYRESFKRRYFLSLGVVFAAIITAVVVQYFYPHLLLEMFFMTAGLLVLSLMTQRPEERIDVVTGLYNITVYMDDMRQAFRNKKPMRIIMVNVTNFSTIRDLVGYGNCMKAMADVAQQMQILNRDNKLDAELYYLDNGKFRFVADEQNFDKVCAVAESVNSIMKHKFMINQMAVNMVTNICITDCPQDILDLDTLMSFGDTLNTLQYTGDIMYASEVLKRIHYDMMRDMDSIIDNALAKDHFAVYYQPIYSVEEKRFVSAEALIRLQDDKYGFVSPEFFIPAAERSGAIHKIGDFVLEEVCKFIASEEFQFLNLEYIEVNLSVVQCMQSNLVEHVMDILNRYHVKPEQINLEITETAASISQQALMDNIENLTSAGIRFSLDDFGTGYSNMQRVVMLPLDIIKLDRSFTDVYDNPKLGIVLTNTINMIKSMDMKIVVEGVETEEMLRLFSDLKCEYIQGYYFSKPIPQNEFTKFIQASL